MTSRNILSPRADLSSLNALAATLGSLVGIVMGASLGLALARVLGIEQSVADYGSAFICVVGSAWLFGILGCYFAMRLVGDRRALLTALILVPVLAIPALLTATGGHADAGGWDFGSLVVAVIVEALLPVASPLIAYVLAGFVSPGQRVATS